MSREAPMPEESFLDEAARQADLALDMSDAWIRPLPDGIRFRRTRSLLSRALEVYTGRQTEFDKAMLVALIALVEELRDMDTRLSELEGSTGSADPPGPVTADANADV
jgi:hypothetical protein